MKTYKCGIVSEDIYVPAYFTFAAEKVQIVNQIEPINQGGWLHVIGEGITIDDKLTLVCEVVSVEELTESGEWQQP